MTINRYSDPLDEAFGEEPEAPREISPAREPPYLAGLNTEQRAAVEATDGPVLVLAGAGTGKTRVLTTRLAHILATRRAWPGQILAVTFTNKAAREMKERIGALIGGVVEGMQWLGTFHSIGAKILRDIRTDIRPTVAEVDLAALRKNVDVLAGTVGPGVGILAVVKADAYGHGALAVARALERKVWGFAVSLVEEGVELRRGGIEAPIVVLGSFYGYAHRDVVAYRLTPVVADEGDVEKFARAADEMAAGARRRCT